ncbi:peptidoglycan editing factor PgeF [Colwellia sp. E2M01]|uniref:peptidoglycan editing factor PgeF n=1 Tax=Colwellia sp. E2M01 TaxID=2841561 RepID=UPI001C08DF18|nr:peptidoglycan editing factor PgeF [Colwellia sp. E2M01]MBU2869157.1 peptidoglycan editing factor PgeF [Colwellia sp. E2M01]
MPKKNTKQSHQSHFINSTFERVKWGFNLSTTFDEQVVAFQTTCNQPRNDLILVNHYSESSAEKNLLVNEGDHPTTYGGFNLGLHVGDNTCHVMKNRDLLTKYLYQEVNNYRQPTDSALQNISIQWLEQVHGNNVVTILKTDTKPITADASITREKNIALAIMTADCLPVLLAHKNGLEIAAIHGGWRPLAANIITKTLEKMQSDPSDIQAWLGPCIGKTAFEVGSEVKDIFLKQNHNFESCFVPQANAKYLADLHAIAEIQLNSLGVTNISRLDECTYQNTNKYYSYRKNNTTGRMASVICRR